MILRVFLLPAVTALVATIATKQESLALSGYCRPITWPCCRPARQLFRAIIFIFFFQLKAKAAEWRQGCHHLYSARICGLKQTLFMKIIFSFFCLSVHLGRYHGGGRVLERSCCDEGDQAPKSSAVVRLVKYLVLSVLT